MDAANKVIDMEYVADIESVVLATHGGDILAVKILGKMSVEQECIGSIETGIESMAWSPDLEVVIFTTRAQTMLAMTQNWDIIFEQAIHPENESAKIAASLAISEPSKIKLQTTINDVARVTEAKSALSAQMEAAKQFMPELSHLGQHTVTWRGDGQFFAVASFLPATPGTPAVASEFRVWERSGKFFSKSEPGVLTQSVLLAWKPSGDILASTQSLPEHDEVIFFERNGLRHYEFKVRAPAASRVHDLQWNASSDILSVLVKLPKGDVNGSWAHQLWTTRNYHWYLKQERFYSSDRLNINWDSENGMAYTVTTTDGDVEQFTLTWETDVTRGAQSDLSSTSHASHPVNTNHSVVTVIDGSSLLVNALKYQVVPPPMATLTLRTPAAISQVAFDLSNNLMTFHSDGTTSLYEHYKPEKQEGKPARYNAVPALIARSARVSAFQNSRQFVLIGNDEILSLSSSVEQGKTSDRLVHYQFIVDRASAAITHTEEISIPLPTTAFKMFQNADTGSVFIQLADASIMHYDVMERLLTPKPMMKLPTLCPWLSSAVFGDGEEHLVGLTSAFKLYVGDTLLSSEATSFALHSDFLLFTTLTHRLRSASLHKTPHENLAILAPKQNVKFDDSVREVEQGSILVAVVPNSTRVVLQMPRGNLEAIEPRSLVLHTVRTFLDRCAYKDAFEIMRKQRINLNFVYDHNPALFMAHIPDFLDQISDVDYLNQFISSLTIDDSTVTTYVDVFGHAASKADSRFHSAATLSFSAPQHSISSATASSSAPSSSAPSSSAQSAKQANANRYIAPIHTDDAAIKARLVPLKVGKETLLSRSKVNNVCDTLRAEMERRNLPERYLLPILTTLVCKTPADIESALRLVQGLRTRELEATGESRSTNASASSTSEKALKYLVFLVDVNHLFDIALGMYDFDLVLLVAQKSQKDPREYLPFLAEISKCEPAAYQRYRINVHLQRWSTALENIATEQDAEQRSKLFDLALQVISKQSLYVAALEMFKGEQRNAILDIYGDSFLEKKDYGNAALAFRTAGKLEKALDAAIADASVNAALSIAYELKLPQTNAKEWEEKLERLAATTTERFLWEDAANVFEIHLSRPMDALHAALSGSLWNRAQAICFRYGTPEKIQSEVVPAVLSHFETVLKTVQERTVKLSKYHNRLITVRANKHLQALSELMPIIEGSETSSMYSGASSSSSVSAQSQVSKSSKTSKTSKSSKASKKSRQSSATRKVSGRKGSPNEEQYLVRELPALFPESRLVADVTSLLSALFLFGHAEKAVQLQQAVEEWNSRATKALGLINTPSPLTREQQQELDASRLNADTLQLALVNPPAIPHVAFKPGDWKLPLVGAPTKDGPVIISPSAL